MFSFLVTETRQPAHDRGFVKPVSPALRHNIAMNPIRFENGRLLLLDQRHLPMRQDWLVCETAAQTADAIRQLVVRGAPAIGVTAAWGLALEAERLQALETAAFAAQMQVACQTLLDSRPTAVNLRWAIEHQQAMMADCLADAAGGTPSAVARRLLAAAQALHADDIALNRRLGAHGAVLLSDNARVLTHCNAGALATAGYGTALGVLRAAREAGKQIRVFADETRPFLQGARLTAWELLQDGFDVTLITDNMAGHLMACGEIDAVIVGADRVTANGDVVNKIGTYMVAVLARQHGIPFYVACPLSTIDLRTATGRDVPIEERPVDEVLGHAGVQWAPPGVQVRNPAFDVTPAFWVTAIITEAGVIHQPAQCDLRDWLSAYTGALAPSNNPSHKELRA